MAEKLFNVLLTLGPPHPDLGHQAPSTPVGRSVRRRAQPPKSTTVPINFKKKSLTNDNIRPSIAYFAPANEQP